MIEEMLREEVNKRLTLNWLIQGASEHAGLTMHHLVRDELNTLSPKLLLLYDQLALVNHLQYWCTEASLLLGWPPRFWKRAATKTNHPFYDHPILSKHGGMLAEEGRQRALARSKEKGVPRWPIFFGFKTIQIFVRITVIEEKCQQELTQLARQVAAQVWDIPQDRLDATLTTKVAFGKLSKTNSFTRWVLRAGAVGYGGVLHQNGSLQVVARAVNFFYLAKELVKGTAELICLHGLNTLDDETYQYVMEQTDRLEYEPWMLQSGGELWRKLLAVAPEGVRYADLLMHLARLPARTLEFIILAVLEEPPAARARLEQLMGAR